MAPIWGERCHVSRGFRTWMCSVRPDQPGAVNDEDVAAMEFRSIRGEIRRWPFDILDGTSAAQRGGAGKLVDDALHYLFRRSFHHAADDEARSDHVGAHAIGAHFHGKPLDHRCRSTFGRCVMLHGGKTMENGEAAA